MLRNLKKLLAEPSHPVAANPGPSIADQSTDEMHGSLALYKPLPYDDLPARLHPAAEEHDSPSPTSLNDKPDNDSVSDPVSAINNDISPQQDDTLEQDNDEPSPTDQTAVHIQEEHVAEITDNGALQIKSDIAAQLSTDNPESARSDVDIAPLMDNLSFSSSKIDAGEQGDDGTMQTGEEGKPKTPETKKKATGQRKVDDEAIEVVRFEDLDDEEKAALQGK